mgnify:CR=1 FL=1
MSRAGAGAPLIKQYASASGAEAQAIAVTFAAITNGVVGVLHLCEGVGVSMWYIGVGVLMRPIVPRFGVFSIVLGVVVALGVAGSMAGIGADFHSSAPAWYLFTPIGIWSAWIGVHVWRGRILAGS